jgi:predicted transcriptional regulator
MTRGEIKDGRAKLMRKILEVSKEGNKKEELQRILGLSHRQLRDLTAELADKGFLRHVKSRGYITTEKGYKFIDASLYAASRQSTLSNKEINDSLQSQ